MEIKALIEQKIAELKNINPSNKDEVTSFYNQYLGPKGALKEAVSLIKEVPADQRKEIGQLINQFKQSIDEKYETLKKIIVEAPVKTAIVPMPKNVPAKEHVTPPKAHAAVTEVIKVKKDPEYNPGDKFWIMVSNKPIELTVGCVRTEETVREFNIFYDCWFDRADLGIDVGGNPSKGQLTKKEGSGIYKTKELLISTL